MKREEDTACDDCPVGVLLETEMKRERRCSEKERRMFDSRPHTLHSYTRGRDGFLCFGRLKLGV